MRRGDAEDVRHLQREERGHDAGDERGIVYDAHAYDFEGKKRCGERRSEERGEHGAHAAERRKAHVLIVKVKSTAYIAAEAAAYLERRALTPGAAAEEVGYGRGNKDCRDEHQRHLIAEMYGIDNSVGVLVLHLREPVEPRDEKTRDRQEKQQPRVCHARTRRPTDAEVEGRADKTADDARHTRDKQPLDEGPYILPGGFGFILNKVHEISVLFLTLTSPKRMVSRSPPRSTMSA